MAGKIAGKIRRSIGAKLSRLQDGIQRAQQPGFNKDAQLFLVRHGDYDEYRGRQLTDVGHAQAAAAGVVLAELGFTHPGLIITTTELRAVQSAEEAAAQLKSLIGDDVPIVRSHELNDLMQYPETYTSREVEVLTNLTAAACEEAHTAIHCVDNFAFFGHEPFIKTAQLFQGRIGVDYGEVVPLNLEHWQA